MARQVVRAYLVFNCVYYFLLSLHFPTYVLFLKQNQLSFAEVGIINTVFMIACFFFEVPTGVIADRFGRRFSVLSGVFMTGVGSMVYYCSATLGGFLVAEIVFAFGTSLISGALDAWITDSLEGDDSQKTMRHVFSKGTIASRGSGLFGALIGGWIGNAYDLRISWLLTSFGMFLATFILARIVREEYFQKKARSNLKRILVDGVKYGYQNKAVWNLVALNAILILGMQAFNMQWSVIFEQKLGLGSVGWVYAGIAVFTILGVLIVNWRMQRGSSEKLVLVGSILLLGTAGILATVFHNGYLILGFFLLHEVGRGGAEPVQKALLQENILSNDKRATVGSFNAMIGRLGAGIGWLASGILADHISIQTCWLISSMFFFLALPFIARIKSKKASAI